MTFKDMWSSKDLGTHKMLEAFLASKGFTPVAPLAPNQLFSVSDLARSKSYTPKAKYFIATVPSPVDTAPRNVYHFDGAAMHRSMAGLTCFSDEKKYFKAFDKKGHQNYILGCLELQDHLVRSKTMLVQKNMELVNEINDKN
jgi:hypothetical protein